CPECEGEWESTDELPRTAQRLEGLRRGGVGDPRPVRHRALGRCRCPGRRHGAERLRQEHAAHHRRQPRGPDGRRGVGRRAEPQPHVARPEGTLAPPVHRLRLPGLQPAARAHRGRERRPPPRARRRAGPQGEGRGHERARCAGPGRARDALPRPALGWRAPAGVDRPGCRGRAQAPPGGRAVRRPRLHQRRSCHAHGPGRVPPGGRRCRRHPRCAAGLVGGPRHVHPRRSHGRPDRHARQPRSPPRPSVESVVTSTLERPRVELQLGGDVPNGGVPARRAVVRWAWRLFRREWRQQLLVLALVTVALAGLVVGSATAADSPAPKDSGFGTALFSATLKGDPATVLSQLHLLQQHVGTTDLIEDDTLSFPGTVDTFNLQSQNPQGPYGQAMLSLLTGRYPTLPGEVAITSGVASAFRLHVGSTWHEANTTYHVVGTVQNPQSLLDEFALVAPGQVPLNASTQVTALFDGGNGSVKGFHFPIQAESDAGNSNAFNPETISLALATIGMLLIGLVAVGGFTVLA